MQRAICYPNEHTGETLEELNAKVERYLPSSYTCEIDYEVQGVIISGVDNRGWTMDDYVIPRLASGMITAHKETEETVYAEPTHDGGSYFI